MTTFCKPFFVIALTVGAASGYASPACDQAWADYENFKRHNVMEPSQYALTIHGAIVRANCGAQALPAPPEADIPHYPVVPALRKPIKPMERPRPGDQPKPIKPQ